MINILLDKFEYETECTLKDFNTIFKLDIEGSPMQKVSIGELMFQEKRRIVIGKGIHYLSIHTAVGLFEKKSPIVKNKRYIYHVYHKGSDYTQNPLGVCETAKDVRKYTGMTETTILYKINKHNGVVGNYKVIKVKTNRV